MRVLQLGKWVRKWVQMQYRRAPNESTVVSPFGWL